MLQKGTPPIRGEVALAPEGERCPVGAEDFAAEEIYLKQATANEPKNKAIFSMEIAGVRAFSFFGLSQKELYFFGYSFIIYCVAYDPFGCAMGMALGEITPQKGSEQYGLRRGFLPPIFKR